MGKRLKAVREALTHTLDSMCEAADISRSYLSEFERGQKIPNSKYLKYLFDAHNVNIHFILSGEGPMFNISREEQKRLYNFGKYEEEIKDLLYHITNVPHALYAVLGFFTEYKVDSEKFLEKYLAKKENKIIEDDGENE